MSTNLDTAAVIDRDRFGRPLIIPPDGGKPVAYTRATTVAKTLDDEGSLIKWAQRMTAAGLARRPDLLALISSKLDANGDIPEAVKNDVQRLCDEAKEHGGGSRAANLGTALHALTEQLDLGQTPVIPEQFADDINAYRNTVEPFQILGVEQFVVHDGYRIGGTFDRLWRLPDGRVVIADLKTGQNLDYSWRSIACQLAIYAHGLLYNNGTRTRLPDDLDPTVGIVIHLPVGAGRCTLHQVDLIAGWEAVSYSMWARGWRTRRDLAHPYKPAAGRTAATQPEPSPAPAVVSNAEVLQAQGDPFDRQQLVTRIRAISATPQGPKLLRQLWPADIPTLKQSDRHTAAELAQISQVVAQCDRELNMPFGPADITRPATRPEPAVTTSSEPVGWERPDDGYELSHTAANQLRAQLKTLPADVRTFINRMLKDADANGRPLIEDKQHTQRSVAVLDAITSVAACWNDRWGHDDDFLRIILAAALNISVDGFPANCPGAAFASLTIAQAKTLTRIADANYTGAEIPITFDDRGHPVLGDDTEVAA